MGGGREGCKKNEANGKSEREENGGRKELTISVVSGANALPFSPVNSGRIITEGTKTRPEL